MTLPRFIHVRDRDRNLATGPMETWVNIDDVSRIGVVCPRTPSVNICLRSEPGKPVLVSGPEAKALIARFSSLRD